MPVPTNTTPANGEQDGGKNIWIAAGEGDIDRVKLLVDEQGESVFSHILPRGRLSLAFIFPAIGVSPTAPDPYTYTPLHAAASYGHVDILYVGNMAEPLRSTELTFSSFHLSCSPLDASFSPTRAHLPTLPTLPTRTRTRLFSSVSRSSQPVC